MIQSFPEPRRGLVQAMMAGPVGEEYFIAPASTKEEHHSAFPGGLADHSLRVTRHLRNLAKTLCPDRFKTETLDFVGLFHDLGKTGDMIVPYYKMLEGPKHSWKRERGEFYETNKECIYMPTQERALFILQNYEIVLTAGEYLAIRLHDGQYDPSNVKYSMKEPDLALLIHFADRWATAQEKISV